MPVIQFNNPNRDKAKVSSYSIQVLEDIMFRSAISTLTVTSTARTPQEQAKVMFDNLELHGITQQKKLYGKFGDRVIDEYSALKQQGKSDIEIIVGMTNKILSIGPSKVSSHAGDPTKINVVDIAPSSIPAAKRPSFEMSVKSDQRVSRFFLPPKDPAYHIEIPQP